MSKEKPRMIGEESSEVDTSAAKNLVASIIIGAIAILATVLAVRMPNPGELSTHPGLLPLLTGISLFGMALMLGVQALRAGAIAQLRTRDKRDDPGGGDFADTDRTRTLALIGIIFVYVLLVDWISFDLRYPTSVFVFRFSSFECITAPVLALILRIFWRAALWRCALVASVVTIALATIFRSGFNILLPGSG